MPTTYEKAGEDVIAVVEQLLERERPDLEAAGVTVEVLMAACEEGPPVKLHGYPCAAVVKVMSLKDRAAGSCDARIILDDGDDGWQTWGEDRRKSVVHHELLHLELVPDKEGKVKRDACGRPRLKTRLHDSQIGIFHYIARKYGPESFDYRLAEKLAQQWEQGEFSWG